MACCCTCPTLALSCPSRASTEPPSQNPNPNPTERLAPSRSPSPEISNTSLPPFITNPAPRHFVPFPPINHTSLPRLPTPSNNLVDADSKSPHHHPLIADTPKISALSSFSTQSTDKRLHQNSHETPTATHPRATITTGRVIPTTPATTTTRHPSDPRTLSGARLPGPTLHRPSARPARAGDSSLLVPPTARA